MKPSEAIEVLALVQASWPHMKLPDETVKAWAFELIDYEAVDAATGIRDLARFQTRPPALADLLGAATEARRERMQTRMLPSSVQPADGPWISFRDWYATQDAEMQARARRVFPKLNLPEPA